MKLITCAVIMLAGAVLMGFGAVASAMRDEAGLTESFFGLVVFAVAMVALIVSGIRDCMKSRRAEQSKSDA